MEKLTSRKKAELRRIAELTLEATLAVDAKMSQLERRNAARSPV